VQQLIAWYWAAAAGPGPPPPLVLNTYGWVAGVGLELLGEALRALEPTHGEWTARRGAQGARLRAGLPGSAERRLRVRALAGVS
jgi:hypothetical protein